MRHPKSRGRTLATGGTSSWGHDEGAFRSDVGVLALVLVAAALTARSCSQPRSRWSRSCPSSKLDLASGLMTGTEALARWTDKVRGHVPPCNFVRVAQDRSLVQQLTDVMLVRWIAEMRRLHDRGHHLPLAVNLSTHHLLDGKRAELVARYQNDHGVDAGALTLEITESSLLVEAPRSRSSIRELHKLGVRRSIDDFRTGYSSSSYLRHQPVSELKADQTFIANMLVDQQDEMIVRSTADLDHNPGVEVVAEAVENSQTLRRLRGIGCDIAQGFTISRPLTTEHLRARLLHTTEFPTRRIDPQHPEQWPIAPHHVRATRTGLIRSDGRRRHASAG